MNQAAAAESCRVHLGGAPAGDALGPDVSHVQKGRQVRKGNEASLNSTSSNNIEIVNRHRGIQR